MVNETLLRFGASMAIIQETSPGLVARALNAQDLLPLAVDKGVAFVPGAAFYNDHGDPRTMRLSFVTQNRD